MKPFDQLLKMKSSRKKPQAGDVFVIQPREGIYFYGKVLRTNVPNPDGFMNGMIMVQMYKVPTREPVMPDHLDVEQLMIPPNIINLRGWWDGYFVTIGNQPVTEADFPKSYGFQVGISNKYLDEEGRLLDYVPEHITQNGLASYGFVGRFVADFLDENPELLD